MYNSSSLYIMPMQDLRLAAEAIVVNASDAAFQIGTVSEAHKHRVDIVLGSLSTAGRKQRSDLTGGVFALSGSLVMNGGPVSVPWTHIDGSAEAGAVSVKTTETVDWKVVFLVYKIVPIRTKSCPGSIVTKQELSFQHVLLGCTLPGVQRGRDF